MLVQRNAVVFLFCVFSSPLLTLRLDHDGVFNSFELIN